MTSSTDTSPGQASNDEPLKMLVDDDWLRRKVDADPDLPCEAGADTNPEGIGELIAELAEAATPKKTGALPRRRLYGEALDALQAQQSRIQALEAERDALKVQLKDERREAIAACDAVILQAEAAESALAAEVAKREAAEGELADVLVMTGCRDRANLEDMANIGRSLLDVISDVRWSGGAFADWMPADSPVEIVFDLLNAHGDEKARADRLEAENARLKEGLKAARTFAAHVRMGHHVDQPMAHQLLSKIGTLIQQEGE